MGEGREGERWRGYRVLLLHLLGWLEVRPSDHESPALTAARGPELPVIHDRLRMPFVIVDWFSISPIGGVIRILKVFYKCIHLVS